VGRQNKFAIEEGMEEGIEIGVIQNPEF